MTHARDPVRADEPDAGQPRHVTAAEIARLAGVGRSAVSNWRRRHADFPRPVGGPENSPTFALPEVEAWLTANSRWEAGRPEPHRGAGSDRDPVGRWAGPGGAIMLLAMAALLPAGVGSDVEIVPGSSEHERLARHPGTTAALVSVAPLTDPLLDGVTGAPGDGRVWAYGQPARTDYPLAWVQLCLAWLEPGGTAAVAVPFAMAVRASGRRIRAELLRAGVLTHVIGLPERAVPSTAYPWQIWVLHRPTARPAYNLRMVDLLDLDPANLPTRREEWDEIYADPARTRDVPSIEVLDEDVFLVPAAHIDTGIRDLAPDYEAASRRYARAAQGLPAGTPTFAPGTGRSPGPLVTIGDLIRSGVLEFVPLDEVAAGDVIIPAGSGGFEPAVATGAPADAGAGASVLRANPEALDPHFLACFLRSPANRRQAAGTAGGSFRLDVKRSRVPRMPVEEQRRYGEAFRRLTDFTAAAAGAAEAAQDAARTAIDALTTGSFAPQ